METFMRIACLLDSPRPRAAERLDHTEEKLLEKCSFPVESHNLTGMCMYFWAKLVIFDPQRVHRLRYKANPMQVLAADKLQILKALRL